jgi:hypothetical protein
MKHLDFSLHFTTKGQTVDDIRKKFKDWLYKDNSQTIPETDCTGEGFLILHHCFMHRKDIEAKGWSTKILDFLEHRFAHIVCWYGASDQNLNLDRLLMLQNLKRVNGVAIFIGEIKDGVKDEYELAKQLGVDTVIIP